MTGHRFSLEFIVNIDKPDVFTLPTPFNVDKHDTGLFNVVVPDTFNEELILGLSTIIIYYHSTCSTDITN